jgi:hypothetical protein
MKKYQSGGKNVTKNSSASAQNKQKFAGWEEKLHNTSREVVKKTPDKPAFVPLPGKKSDKPAPVTLPGKKSDNISDNIRPYKQGGTINPTTMKNKPAPKKKMSAKEMEAMKKAKTPMMKYGGKMGKKSC